MERGRKSLDAPLERPAPPSKPSMRHAHGRRLPVVFVILALIVFAGSIGYAYRQGMVDAQGEGGEVPVVRAEKGPTRLKPETPGGLQVPNQDKLVYDRMTGAKPGENVEHLLSPAETPMAKPSPEPAETAAKDVKVGVTRVVPLKLPRAKPEAPARATGAERKPAIPVEPPKPKPGASTNLAKSPPMPSARPSTLPSGSFGLQLAAFRDPNAIPPLWRKLKASHVKILGKLRVKVLRITVSEKGVFHRLIAGPFPTEATARVACQSLKSRNQDCFVVRY